MEGKEGDRDSCNSTEMSEEEFEIDKEGGEWEQVGRGGRGKGESGRKKEDKDSVEDRE